MGEGAAGHGDRDAVGEFVAVFLLGFPGEVFLGGEALGCGDHGALKGVYFTILEVTGSLIGDVMPYSKFTLSQIVDERNGVAFYEFDGTGGDD